MMLYMDIIYMVKILSELQKDLHSIYLNYYWMNNMERVKKEDLYKRLVKIIYMIKTYKPLRYFFQRSLDSPTTKYKFYFFGLIFC